MPRVYFTGRKKIPQNNVSVIFRSGPPPEFEAAVDLSRLRRSLPPTAKVVIEAYHNTVLQRFDLGTVADCRPRDSLRLSSFDDWDRPRFRVRVVGDGERAGIILASCERVDAVEPEAGADGGRSMLKLYPKPDTEMNGELWKVADIGGYQLWYNKDVASVASGIKSKRPDVLGLILPAALREILARTHLWENISAEPDEWTAFAQQISGEPFPSGQDGEAASKEDVEEWIDRAIGTFCRSRARFVERIAAIQEVGP
jgi:hypothetical protein